MYGLHAQRSLQTGETNKSIAKKPNHESIFPCHKPDCIGTNSIIQSHLVLGNFPIAEGLLLAIINASMDDLFGRPRRGEKRTVPSSMMALEDKVMPNILNLRCN